jgi:hypothetical protein
MEAAYSSAFSVSAHYIHGVTTQSMLFLGGCSVGIVRLRTKTTEFVCPLVYLDRREGRAFWREQSPHWLLYDGYWGLFPASKAVGGHETDHSPPFSAEVKNGGAIPPHPNTSSCRGA